MKRLLFTLTAVLYSCLSFSGSSSWNFKPVTIRDEMNNNTIYNICYDRQGLVWLSTDTGINRYDGFRFRNYPLVTSLDSASLPLPKAVSSITESTDGLFYVQLRQGGIIVFDYHKETYVPVHFNRPFDTKSIINFVIASQKIYLGTTDGLYQGSITRSDAGDDDHFTCVLDNKKLADGKITSLCGDNSNLYMIVDEQKVTRYDITAKKSTSIEEGGKPAELFLRKGSLWIYRNGDQLVYYDLKERTERLITLDAGYLDSGNSYLTDIVPANGQNYYLTIGNGLFHLKFDAPDLTTGTYSLEAVADNTGHRITSANIMTSVFWDDEQQILWVGTFGGGMMKLNLSDKVYSCIEQKLESKICGMVEGIDGYVWLVMADGKIMKSSSNYISPKTVFTPWKKLEVPSGSYCMYKDKKRQIWLGSDQGNVIFIDPLTDKITISPLLLKDKPLVTHIYQLCLDSQNHLWIATHHGLLQADPNTLVCKQVTSGEAVYAVVKDKVGNIWVGSGKGLKRLEISEKEINLRGNYEKENGLEPAPVTTIYVNNSNQIYATYQNIIIRIDGREKDKVESVYTLREGLTNGHVLCMMDDMVGNTWAGNNTGIMTIRNGQSAFNDYLSGGMYNAVCLLSDGRLLWANSSGLLYFNPAAQTDTLKRKLHLTGLELDGVNLFYSEYKKPQIYFPDSPDKPGKFVFDTKRNNFHMYFSDLRYDRIKRKIAYRLLPEDKQWKAASLAEGLWFKHLPEGDYVLEAKLIYPDGEEGEVLQIPIIIAPRWYCTLWMYMVYALLVGVLSYCAYRYIKKKEVKRELFRERELTLEKNLNSEKIKREQRQELETMHNQILMQFVQELRTPLSLIIGPLKDLIKEYSSFGTPGRVAYRNTLRMLNACDQLRSVYGGDALAEKLEIAPYLAEKLVDDTLLDIQELIKAYNMNLSYEKRIKKDLEIYADKKILQLIIRNILSNAFTHIHYTGTVSLSLCETMEAGERYFTITVEDDGKSEVKSLRQFFSEEDTWSNDLSTIELGYGMMRRMLKKHHGSIMMESSAEGRTKVTVNLPVSRLVYEKDENIIFVEPEELSKEQFESMMLEETKPELVEEIVQGPDTDLPVAQKTIFTPNTKRKYTLLIVEDHKDIRLYLKVLFGKEYNLLMANNGQEGVDIATKELPDLIICDIMMPVMDGFECCREIKEGLETCSIPFIMLTAKVEDDDVVKGLEMGADDYILKPFTPSILKAKVSNMISVRQGLKQTYTKLLMLPGTDTAPCEEVAETEEDPFIREIIKIIETNICEAEFNVKSLANELNMSQPTLYRKVKQSTDYSITELIRGVRMRRAAVLLKLKLYGVQQVSEMVGYNDAATFRKHFVDAFGTTPSTYE